MSFPGIHRSWTRRWLILPTLLPLLLGGCCLTSISGLALDGGPTGSTGLSLTSGASSGATSPSSSGSGTAGTSSGSGFGSSTGTTGGGGSSTGTTGTPEGTSTGATTPPGFLMDAGMGTVFGPVALAPVPGFPATAAARLAYAQGDGGQFGIMLVTLDESGLPSGPALQLATTGDQTFASDAGIEVEYPYSPPNVTVSDDGIQIGVCWEDYSMTDNPYPSSACAQSEGYSTAAIRCQFLRDTDEAVLDGGYTNCGLAPHLVFNPTQGDTQLFFTDGRASPVEQWAVGQAPTASQFAVTDNVANMVPVPTSGGLDAVVYSGGEIEGNYASGLSLVTAAFANGGFMNGTTQDVDTDYFSNGYPTPFSAAGAPPAGAIAIVEIQDLKLREQVWQEGASSAGTWVEVPSSEPLEGAIAAGVCGGGFIYVATTGRGKILLAPGPFDGGLDPSQSRLVTLPDFDPTPGLVQEDNSYIPRFGTSLAIAEAPGGKMFLAISNPWQVAAYLLTCQ